MLLLPAQKQNINNNLGKEQDDEYLYKTYDSKSNQEVFSEKMNLKQQETKELACDDPSEKPMEYQ